MKRNHFVFAAAMVGTAVLGLGCGRQTRGNADADAQSRAATAEEGGNTSTAGSAGQAKNFGDTSRSGANSEVTPPERPKQFNTTESNAPAQQPRDSTKEKAENSAR